MDWEDANIDLVMFKRKFPRPLVWNHTPTIQLAASNYEAIKTQKTIQQTLSYDDNCCPTSQEIISLLRNPKDHYHLQHNCHWTLPWVRWIQSTPSHFNFLTYNLILLFHLCPKLFPPRLPTKILHTLSTSTTCFQRARKTKIFLNEWYQAYPELHLLLISSMYFSFVTVVPKYFNSDIFSKDLLTTSKLQFWPTNLPTKPTTQFVFFMYLRFRSIY